MTRHAHEHDPPIGDEPDPDRAEAELTERLGDEMRGHIEIVTFGLDVQAFMEQNPVGKYLVARAEAELNAATQELLDMNTVRGKKARDVFDRAKIAVKTLRWLNEAIAAGLESEQAIQALDPA